MYEFLAGPMVLISLLVFGIGLFMRLVWYIRGLDWKLDRVAYTQNIGYGAKGALRSVFFWLIPFGTRSWRQVPLYTIMVFGFHVALLLTPVFLSAHNILVQESLGFSLWTLPDVLADALTLVVIVIGCMFCIRRLGLPEVRILTTLYDILVLLIAMAPFLTGLLARHQVGDYTFWLYAHIISGEVLLMAIPFTKLSHFLLFFLSRIQLGMDFGTKRGGMKSKGMAW